MNESSNRNPDTTKGDTPAKAPFTEPKLTFVSPQLVKRGGIAELTAGTFWGTFMSGAEYPPADTGGQEPP